MNHKHWGVGSWELQLPSLPPSKFLKILGSCLILPAAIKARRNIGLFSQFFVTPSLLR